MRRRLLCALLAGACSMAAAQEGRKPSPPLVSIERQGYAFEFPRVLAQQRLFGIAHGVSLLAAACLDVNEHADAAGEAYSEWRDRQSEPIETAEQELAEFYFGARAREAEWTHIVRALNLREKLDYAADSPELAAACASLPQALQQPRYNLIAMFRLEAALAAASLAARAETLSARCLKFLPEAQRPSLESAFTTWQEGNTEAAEAARAEVRANWTASGSQGEAEAWLAALPQRHARTGTAVCRALDTWLLSSQAALRDVFAPPPAPTPPAAATEDNVVLPVAPAAAAAPVPVELPVEVQQAPSPVQDRAPAEVVHDDPPPTYPSLFDLLMRLFDERPHEADAEHESGSRGTRARSPRAHP